VIGSKAFVDRQAGEFDVFDSQNLFGVGAGKDDSPLPIYQEQALFEMAYYLSKAATHQLQLGSFAGKPFAELSQTGSHSGDRFIAWNPGIPHRANAAMLEVVDACGDRLQRF
jgi:hypothetical protein